MPISNPTQGDVHVSRPLTNFAQKYMQDESAFVAGVAMPNIPVSKSSDSYYVFDRADFYRDEAQETADGTPAPFSGFGLSTDSYNAKVQRFSKPITDRQRADQDEMVDLDRSSTEFVTRKLMIRRERLFATRFMATSLWATDLTAVASGPVLGTSFLRWDLATADPIIDIRAQQTARLEATGYKPNKLLLQKKVWDAIADNDAVLSRIAGGATPDMPAKVLRRHVAELLELEEIHVMEAVVNTAAKGATEATGFIAGKHALLYYAPSGVIGRDTPTAGARFSWKGYLGATGDGLRIKRFREEKVEADWIEGQMAFDFKRTGSELGCFFSGAVA